MTPDPSPGFCLRRPPHNRVHRRPLEPGDLGDRPAELGHRAAGLRHDAEQAGHQRLSPKAPVTCRKNANSKMNVGSTLVYIAALLITLGSGIPREREGPAIRQSLDIETWGCMPPNPMSGCQVSESLDAHICSGNRRSFPQSTGSSPPHPQRTRTPSECKRSFLTDCEFGPDGLAEKTVT